MDDLIRIPCVMMRGGTSKGPFFLSRDLPADPVERDRLLLEIMGSGHPLQIDGIGGGNSLTSKVAIVGPSSRPEADVDYLFAQVKVLERSVDTAPNCGNMLSAVGPFAIEAGLVQPTGDETVIKVHNVNTGKIIDARIQTPGGAIAYQGEAAIDGVPGKAAPVYLAFRDAIGAKTGRLLPSGKATDVILGLEVTLLDGATPVVIITGEDMGYTGSEPAAVFDADADFMARLEQIRREAGRLMGMGDVSQSVLPKPVLIGAPANGGDLAVRYFTPANCHTALATTGAVSLGLAATIPTSLVGQRFPELSLPATLAFEHPTGELRVRVEKAMGDNSPTVSVMRTTRRLFEGAALVRKDA
ncbi:4-oxalomesaconate tautomerase [Ensifer sp. NPDC090286]|uniref:4-oxalomesaconate tautomerase n=1 Tax=Ensifer sp. NPDC090286 TaxID=3363991 RepID=UPI00383B822C